MKMSRHLRFACGAAVIALTVTACGDDGAEQAAGSKTLTVWLMDGDLSPAATQAVNAAFEKATGAKVNVQIQQWDSINTKISTALAQNNPPDVLDIGNTDVPLFAATGALTDITGKRQE